MASSDSAGTRQRRKRAARPGELLVQWGTAERGDAPALIYSWGGKGASSPDGRLMCSIFEDTKYLPAILDEKSVTSELERRGYDLTTLRFSIQQKVSRT